MPYDDPGATLTSTEVAALNDGFRVAAENMSQRDFLSLADVFGVHQRTVERWGTYAGERRDIVPVQYVGKEYQSLPAGIRDRYDAAEAFAGGFFHLPGELGELPTYRVNSYWAGDNVRELFALRDGDVDPFLARQWRQARIVYDVAESFWTVQVIYSRSYDE